MDSRTLGVIFGLWILGLVVGSIGRMTGPRARIARAGNDAYAAKTGPTAS